MTQSDIRLSSKEPIDVGMKFGPEVYRVATVLVLTLNVHTVKSFTLHWTQMTDVSDGRRPFESGSDGLPLVI